MSEPDRNRERERLIGTYRKRAGHYDLTARLSPVPGYPQWAQRRRAVRALALSPGDEVVDVACGTGLNFSLIERAIGPRGRIIGVDLTDAMLARARERVEANRWGNVRLEQGDAAEFGYPVGADAILSTFALTQVPDCGRVIAHGAAALRTGGRWVVLDLRIPDRTPDWMLRVGAAVAPPAASFGAWAVRRPWDAIRVAMREFLDEASWTDLFAGTAFLAVGRGRGTEPVSE